MARQLEAVEVGIGSYYSAAQATELAGEAEGLGFPRLWLAENYYHRSATTLAAVVASRTRSLGLGLGVLNWNTRVAPLIAMEAATLAEISHGRLTLGLGAGGTPAQHLGLRQPAVAGLRETIGICRELFAGATLGWDGRVYSIAPGSVRLGVTPPEGTGIPIFVGGMGPNTLRLAGSSADGVFLSVFTSPGFAGAVREHVEAGLRESGRTWSDVWFGAYVLFSVGRDREAARQAVKPTIVDYLAHRNLEASRFAYDGIEAGTFEEARSAVREALSAGGMSSAVRAVPDWLCDVFAVAGTPDECAERLGEFAEAGLKTVIPFNILGPDPLEGLRLVAREVVPAVCR